MPTTSSTSSHSTPGNRPSGRFAPTRWSLVLAAGGLDTQDARAALETLCRIYWPPLYAYVRGRGFSPEDARDLTQTFFERLLERRGITSVDRAKGRFRSFLLACMNHFLSDEWDKARALKRGGEDLIVVELEDAEAWFDMSASESLTPERAYERRWAVTLLEQVYRKLQAEHERQGKIQLFTVLRGTLAGKTDEPYAALGARLNLSEGAVKVAAHRLRKRYRELLRETIAETVSTPEEVEDELRYLFQVVQG